MHAMYRMTHPFSRKPPVCISRRPEYFSVARGAFPPRTGWYDESQNYSMSSVPASSCLLRSLAQPAVRTGIDVLKARQFDILKGKRVGLITNPTGVDATLHSTIDVLFAAHDVKLVALFGPEHGVRGDFAAGDRVDTYTDAAHRPAGVFALRENPKTDTGDAQGDRRPGLRYPGQRLPVVHLHQHHGSGDGSRSHSEDPIHRPGPPEPARWEQDRREHRREAVHVVRQSIPHPLCLRTDLRRTGPAPQRGEDAWRTGSVRSHRRPDAGVEAIDDISRRPDSSGSRHRRTFRGTSHRSIMYAPGCWANSE